jgi:hypothetical protein
MFLQALIIKQTELTATFKMKNLVKKTQQGN